jgi:hypothetical protein
VFTKCCDFLALLSVCSGGALGYSDSKKGPRASVQILGWEVPQQAWAASWVLMEGWWPFAHLQSPLSDPFPGDSIY